MTAPRLRHRLRTLLALVALCACGSAAWVYLSPQERWRRAIRDPETLRWYDPNEAAFTGQVWGLDDHSAVAELILALGDRDPTVRINAALGLALFGVRDEAAAPALVAATRDPEARVQSQAIFSLLHDQVAPPDTVARDQAVSAAVRALADPDKMVRMVAAQSLAEVGHGEEALPVLVGALKEYDFE